MKSDSEYSRFGQVISPPDKPDPPQVEPPRLNYAAVLKKFRWSDVEFELAQRFGFPPSLLRASVARTQNEPGGAHWEKVWPEDKLDVWAAGLMAEIRSLHLK
jgi:hypothetical protein